MKKNMSPLYLVPYTKKNMDINFLVFIINSLRTKGYTIFSQKTLNNLLVLDNNKIH